MGRVRRRKAIELSVQLPILIEVQTVTDHAVVLRIEGPLADHEIFHMMEGDSIDLGVRLTI